MLVTDKMKKKIDWLENYYDRLSKENDTYKPNLIAIKSISKILNKPTLNKNELAQVHDIFMQTSGAEHHEGSAWLDLGMLLASISVSS